MNLLRRLSDYGSTVAALSIEYLVARLEQVAEDSAHVQLDWYARGFAAGVDEGYALAAAQEEASSDD